MKELKLKHLQYAYHLRGWKLFGWRIFLKYVYPSWEKGFKEHWKLIEDGSIVHVGGNDNSPCCGD